MATKGKSAVPSGIAGLGWSWEEGQGDTAGEAPQQRRTRGSLCVPLLT